MNLCVIPARGGSKRIPQQIQDVIQTLSTGFTADGNGDKVPAPSELPDRDWRADPTDGLRPFRHLRETWHP